MRDSHNAFHLAIPCRDLDEAQDFYVTQLGCHLARRYPDRVTLDFFGDQLVCHLTNQIEAQSGLYPRHFGVTFYHRVEFDNLVRLATVREIPFFHAPVLRFEGRIEEHWTLALIDPSFNILEFKHYRDPRMMF